MNEIEKGQQIDAVYTDFVKAFDRIDHNILIRKQSVWGLVVAC